MYKKNQIPDQRPNEKVLLFLRRHWVHAAKLIMFSLLLLVFGLAVWAGTYYLTNFLLMSGFRAIFTLIISAYYLFVVMFSFYNFVDYYLDVWVVTDQRIINIEQKGLFTRVMSEKDLARMQDITANVDGFFPTVFNYGDIMIQTAGEKNRFIFKQIPHAAEVARQISLIVTEYRKKYGVFD